MKISKEEKSLYNFLNVVYSIFTKSTYRNTIVGRGNKLYFFTQGYAGMFVDQDRETLVKGNYDFGNALYEIKQIPSKSFVLDVYELEDKVFDETVNQAITLITALHDCKEWKLEYKKDYEYKLSKIAEETNKWLKDTDIKYLDRFKEAEVFQLSDTIIIKSHGLTDEDVSNVTTVLAFIGDIAPTLDDATQQKMDVDETLLIEGTTLYTTETTDVQESVEQDGIMEDEPMYPIYPEEMENESFEDETNLDTISDDQVFF
ncbi:MAG: hypothetical protein RR585_03155 [Coprobacillus sp.]